MQQIHPGDRLSPEDALFLYLEKAEMPLHIGNVSIFDGAIPLEAFIAHVESKLPSIPQYRQRIEIPPLNLSHPAWADDPGFDIRRHILRVSLKNGTDADVQDLAGGVFAEIMDSRHPLWDITLVDGLRRGRTAMIARVHHCLADGVAGTGLLRLVLDDQPAVRRGSKAEAFHAQPATDAAACLAGVLAGLASDAINGLITVQAATLDLAQALVGNHAAASLEQWAGLAADMVESMERLPFNVACRGPRRHLWIDFAERKIAAIREACGGTLNDVVLALVTAAVRKYTEDHAQAVEKRLLRIVVPVNLRSPGEEAGMGNRVSFLPLIVPLDIRSIAQLLTVVRDRTQALKRSHVVELINLAAAWLGAMPAPFQAILGQLGNRVPIAPFHLVCTNVPGSRVPLYLLGREMLRSYPYVPIGNEMGFCCAVQSYNGRVYFGLTADTEGVPDADRLRDYINESFEELCAAAGIVPKPAKKVQRRAPRRKPASRSRRNVAAPEAPPKPESEVETPAEAPTASAAQVEPEEAWPAARPRRRRARPLPVVSEPVQAIIEPAPEMSVEAQPSAEAPTPSLEQAPAQAPTQVEPEAAGPAARPRRRRARPQPVVSEPVQAIIEPAPETAVEAQPSAETATTSFDQAPAQAPTKVEPEEAGPAGKPRRRRARPQPVESVPEQAVTEPEAPAPEVPAAANADFETSEDVTAEPVFVS